jgi:hypothetical protein
MRRFCFLPLRFCFYHCDSSLSFFFFIKRGLREDFAFPRPAMSFVLAYGQEQRDPQF